MRRSHTGIWLDSATSDIRGTVQEGGDMIIAAQEDEKKSYENMVG